MTDVDIEDALKFPVRGDDALKIHAVAGGVPVLLNVVWTVVAIAGIVLPFLWLLYLPLVPLQLAVGILWLGYFLRVVRRTFAGATEPPALDDWGSLIRDGLWGTLVVLAYQVPALVLSMVGYGVVFVAMFGAGGLAEGGAEGGAAAVGVVGALLMLVVFGVVLLYSLAAGYLLPASLIAYADEGHLGAAFSVERLKTVTYSQEYAIPWIVVAGVYGAVAGVVSFLASLLIGYLLVPFLPLFYFYLGTAAFYMLAQAYATRTGMAVPEVGPSAEGTAEGTAPGGAGGGTGTEDGAGTTQAGTEDGAGTAPTGAGRDRDPDDI